MKSLIKVTLCCLTIVCVGAGTLIDQLYAASSCSKKEPHILLVYKKTEVTGGVEGVKNLRGLHGSEVYTLNLFKHLTANGVPVEMLIINDQALYGEYLRAGLPVYTLSSEGSPKRSLVDRVHEICKQTGANIVHCGGTSEVEAITRAAMGHSIHVVSTMHCENTGNNARYKEVDGILCVSARSEVKLNEENKRRNLGIKHIKFLAPFFDEHACLQFKAKRSRADFFKQVFNVSVKNVPLITMVANFYLKFKDHATVLRAVQKLIYDEHIPVQVAFAGCGSTMRNAVKLAKELHISDSVYFLGHINTVPELFYHSDIAVLSSLSEAFGIVLLEAALMKKPLVGTRGTGMESIVKHQQTGLLFNMRDVNGLAACFKQLIQNQQLACQLGNAAYNFTMDHFVSQATVRELLAFYNDVLQG